MFKVGDKLHLIKKEKNKDEIITGSRKEAMINKNAYLREKK
jgi:hypothetical protein